MVRLSDYDTGPAPQQGEPDPNSAKSMGLKLVQIGQDLDARKDTDPRDALLEAAVSLDTMGLDEFGAAARRLAQLDDAEVGTGAKELGGAVTLLMTKLVLAMQQARIGGGNAEIDPSLDAHRPKWAKHL